MMETEKTFSLTLVTPDGVAFQGDVVSVVVQGAGGKFGMLAGHMPLLSLVDAGTLVCRDASGGWFHFEIGEGILEATPEGVEIMTDSAERVAITLAPRF